MSEIAPTSEEMVAAIQVAAETFKVIAAFGSDGVPSGNLYAELAPKMNYSSYTAMITLLKRTNLVREENHKLFALSL